MSEMTVSRLRAWRPGVLEEQTAEVLRVRAQVEEGVVEAGEVRRGLPEVWTGAAADAATSRLRGHAASGDRLLEALDVVRRTLLGACDAITAAQGLLERAADDARRAGVTIAEDGTVSTPAPRLLRQDVSAEVLAEAQRARIVQLETADMIQACVRQALRAAEEADEEAAHALSRCWEVAADGSGTDPQDRAMTDAVVLRDVPGTGTAPAEVAAWWASLSPQARELLITRDWVRIADLDGVPLSVRARANRLAISAALQTEIRRQGPLALQEQSLSTQIAEIEASGRRDASTLRALGDLWERLIAVRAEHSWSRTQADWYQSLLGDDPPRQVVLFDPAGGRFAEVVGDLATATSVGVLVPGTGAHVGPEDGSYERAFQLVEGDSGSVAMVTYLGGPMPQHPVFESPSNSYARAIGPGLARFVAGIDHAPSATVTVVGHSYGGSVVGAAELAGMRPDRIVHVASAGIGPGVTSPDQLPYPETPRYSMTAPRDLITISQGQHAGDGIGHGADPDEFPGVTRLETGLWDIEDPTRGAMTGKDAHGGVFDRKSTAWANIRAVIAGQDVTLYTPPFEATTPQGIPLAVRYPMEDPDFEPPTASVP